MRFQKMGWMLGLAVIALSGCGSKDECDFSSILIDQADGTVPVNFHDVPANAKIAQRFQPSSGFTLAAVSFTIEKVGSPSGTIKVSIHQDDGDRPADSPISDGGPETVDVSVVATEFLSPLRVKFPGEPDLSSGTDYYLVIDFTEGVVSENYFQLGSASGSSAYPNGELWRFDSEDDEDTAWTPFSNEDLQFRIEKCESND